MFGRGRHTVGVGYKSEWICGHSGCTLTSVARLAVFLVLLLPASAQAGTTLVLPDGTERPAPYQSWTDRWGVGLGGYVVFHPEPRARTEPGFDGTTTTPGFARPGPPAELWVDPAHPDREEVLVHELGHLFDYAHLTDSDRGTFLAITREDRAWTEGGSFSPRERFAAAYMGCAIWPSITNRSQRRAWWTRRHRFYGQAGYQPTWHQHRKVCALIARVAD